MSEKNERNEPSMEDILASIRRIIAEDEEPISAPADVKAAEQAPPKGDDETVLELTELVEESDAKATAADLAPEPKTEPQPVEKAKVSEDDSPSILSVFKSLGASEGQASSDSQDQAKKESKEIMEQTKRSDSVLSEGPASAVTAALADFAGELNKDKDPAQPVTGNSALEMIVRQALEPHLKSWLDENLEAIVERLVKDELRRMAHRAEDY